MGAAKAILVSDEALAGSDALAHRQGAGGGHPAGRAGPGGRGHRVDRRVHRDLPVQVAELLGMPSVTFAKSVTTDGTTVKVERQTEAGYDEVECPLPAVVTVTAGVVEPRYPSFKGIMAAKSKPVDTLTVADLGHRRLAGGRRPGPGRRSPRWPRPRPARPARSWWTRATAPSASSPSSSR